MNFSKTLPVTLLFLLFSSNSHPEYLVKIASFGSNDPNNQTAPFSLKTFNNQLYIGTYGFDQNKPRIYKYNGSAIAADYYSTANYLLPGIIQESVCSIEEFDGSIFINTETVNSFMDSAWVFNWNESVSRWIPEEQHARVGCGLTVLGDYLYATFSNATTDNNYIYSRSIGGSWEELWKDPVGGPSHYIREIISYNDKVYAFSVDIDTGIGYWHDSSKNNFAPTPTSDPTLAGKNVRFFRGHVANGYLWLTSSSKYCSNDCKNNIWRFDGVHLEQMTDDNYFQGFEGVTDINSYKGTIVAVASKSFVAPNNQICNPNYETCASVYVSYNNGYDWKKIWEFDDGNDIYDGAYALEVYKNSVYVATKNKIGNDINYGALFKINNLLSRDKRGAIRIFYSN
ncbi:MAG: hypothetical protein ACYDBT_02275 [Desulfobulbaceae bacterium]